MRIHSNRSLTIRRASSSLRSSSFPQWNNDRQQASLSLLAGASSSSASAVAPLTPSTPLLQQQQQQQDRWCRKKSASASTTITGNHPGNKPAAGGVGPRGHGGGGRLVSRPKKRHTSAGQNGHASSSSSPPLLSSSNATRARGEMMYLPFAYRAPQQQNSSKHFDGGGGGGGDNRRYPQPYQDKRHQNVHRPLNGASRFPSSFLSSLPFKSNSNRGGPGAAAAADEKHAARMKWEQQEQEKRRVKQYKAMIQQTEKELVKLVQQDLVQLTSQYRLVLNSNTAPLSDNNRDNEDDDKNDKNHFKTTTTLQPKHAAWSSASISSINGDDASARLVKSLIQTITETLDDLHQTGRMMEWSQIQGTENAFRQVCTLLQETVRKSSHVHPIATLVSTISRSSPNNKRRPIKTTKAAAASADSSSIDQDDEDERERLKDWMDLTACCLRQLDILIAERTLLVEATRKRKSETPSKLLLEKCDIHSSSSSSSSSVKGWASSLFPSFLLSSDKETAKPSASSIVALLFGSQNSREETKVDQEEQQQQQPPRKEYVFMAHEDISLGPTQDLFRLAIDSIASTIPQQRQQQQQSQPLFSPSPLDESSKLSSAADPRVLAAANEKYRQALQLISDRLVQLLDLVPTDSTPDLTNVQTVLEITSFVGTLESARECSRIFDIATSAAAAVPLSPPFDGSSPEHAEPIPFTLVLRAYLGAAKYEKDKHKRIVVAQEAAKLLRARWNQHSPRDKVKRIAQTTIVLHCMAIVMARACASSSTSLTAETISFFCNDAGRLFHCAVNTTEYNKFRDVILAKDELSLNGSASTTSSSAIDYRFLPMVNYLVRILALPGNADGDSTEHCNDGFRRLEQAKLMICKMVSDCNRNSSSSVNNKTTAHSAEDESSSSTRQYMTIYPDVETVNAVIRGMVHRYREQLQHQQDKNVLLLHSNMVEDDLKVATKLLDFTMSRREVGIWPNDETFGGMSDLLTVLKPSNVGEQLEKLLDQMETRRYFSHRLMPITISLSVYNRVLWGLWQEAQLYKTEPRGTIQRAQALLERLEMRSTPLWMTHGMVRKLHSIAPLSANLLYDLGLKPSKQTYELVLHVCASTAAPSEFEMAASVASKVVERMQQLGMKDGKVISRTLRTCAGRLPQDSDTRQYVQSLLMMMDEGTRLAAHSVTGQELDEAADKSSVESIIAGDAALVEKFGTSVAARATAYLLEGDDDDGDLNDLLGEAATPPEGENADDHDEYGGVDVERIAFGVDGMETAEAIYTIEVAEEQEEQDNQEKSDDGDSDGSTVVYGHGKTIVAEIGTVPEDSAAVARSWIESIEDREDEFMKALVAEEISMATMVVMLVEIGAFKNEQDFIASNKDCRKLLYEWGTAPPQSRPYCLLNKDQLLKIAKDLGIKKAHSRWKEKTILNKILGQHATEGSYVMMMEEGSNGVEASDSEERVANHIG